jgi:hypothetical protein
MKTSVPGQVGALATAAVQGDVDEHRDYPRLSPSWPG